ncbi:MAG: amino acid permease [Bacteroidota bacterium]
MPKSQKKIGWWSATAIVIANMVGTGVFTTLGFQLEAITNTWSIALIWGLGGVISLFGAFAYAEIGTRLPKSGGEYYFLSTIFHPFVGYLSGWVSITVGFAAPIALAAMAMGAYLQKLLHIPPLYFAILVILLTSSIHSISLSYSSRFQNVLTLFKIVLMLGLIFFGFWFTPSSNALILDDGWQEEIWLPTYAVALVYVVYSYSGWNAAAYIVGEIEAPARNLPRALVGGTLLVSILYILLQITFLRQAPLEALQGKVEVGQIVAEHMFGERGGQLVSLCIGLLLIAGISAMIWVGPRVTRAMSDDYKIWRFLAIDNANGVPVRAIWLQAAISIFMIVTSSFEQVLIYSGFILQLFTTLTVIGLFILRKQKTLSQEHIYRSPWHPWLALVYIAISCWILIFLVIDKPMESLLGLSNLFVGALSYFWSKRSEHLS